MNSPKKDVALLVNDKSNLNIYDIGFENVLNKLNINYSVIDIEDISSNSINLSNYKVVISNIMGTEEDLISEVKRYK